jgi:hypothetical protein
VCEHDHALLNYPEERWPSMDLVADMLVMHAEDRLGRDVVETGYLAKRIIDNGVRIFFADGTERKVIPVAEWNFTEILVQVLRARSPIRFPPYSCKVSRG